jgi:hypothetical protein
MKTTSISVLLALALFTGSAQTKKDLEQRSRNSRGRSISTIQDRAGGTHNASNIGLFFENRGKLYPHEYAQGPSGEFPIGSQHQYIYRINPFVGIRGNVIQGRYTSDEEWEAVNGYNNRDSAKIAFSDKPYTWPATGWPVKDASGRPVFVSDQDSYCVYSDSTNSKRVLGIQVNQTGYAFSAKLIQDMIVYTFQVIDRSAATYDSLYFGMYIDIDVGDDQGGFAEYQDDKLDFDKSKDLLYFYDSKGYSRDWNAPTGLMGGVMLKTPSVGGTELGITDMHYNVYDDDYDRDTIQYGIMSSAPSLYHSGMGSHYFHLGANAPVLHFDDPATIPATGLDLVSNIGSGPYTIHPGDTLTFVFAIVAGNTKSEIVQNAVSAHNLFSAGYVRPRPPMPVPKISVVPGDGRAFISWDNLAEFSRDAFSGHVFEGYKVYKSIDLGQHWDQIDRNIFPTTGPDPVPMAVFDRIDGVPPDDGLQYSLVDSNLTNGLEYWYSVTAYDRGDSVLSSLENARGNDASAPNLGVVIPRSNAIGRTPVGVGPVQQTGSGSSNVVFSVQPNDVPAAGGRTYHISFAPCVRVEQGKLQTIVSVTVDSELAATAHTYSVAFLSSSSYRLRDLTLGAVLAASMHYTSDSTISVSGLRITMRDTAAPLSLRPQPGDSIVIGPGLRVTAGGIEVLPLTPARYSTRYATSNGTVISFVPAEPVKSIRQTSGSSAVTVSASAGAPDSLPDEVYTVRLEAVFTDTGHVLYARVTVRNAADSLVARADSLRPGGTVSVKTLSLRVDFDSTASAGTTVEVTTVMRRPLTYADVFTFTTVGAKVDQNQVASGLSRVKVVPNPYVVSSLYEIEYGALRREPIRQIKFINLPPSCTITVFTVAGDKVKDIDHNSTDGTESWDLRGAGGRVIAPGVYVYIVRAGNAQRLDRFAIIK